MSGINRIAPATWALLLLASAAAPVRAFEPSPVLIDETFDSYADQAAFEAIWQPANPLNLSFQTPLSGVLIPESTGVVTPPNDFPPDLQGQAVYVQNALNIYAGPAQPQLDFLTPTPTHSIKLSADFFDDMQSNKRTTIGLRSAASPSPLNVIELGYFNGNVQDPTDPNAPPSGVPTTGFAYRIIQFGPVSPPLVTQPNFQYFPLDPALDGPDADALVRPNDIGQGWHRYSAEIGLDFVTVTLDLFRDGLNNVTGLPGEDSSVTWPIVPRSAPFNRLQFGGAAGATSIRGSVVDNVRLELVETVPEPGAAALLTIGIFAVCRRR